MTHAEEIADLIEEHGQAAVAGYLELFGKDAEPTKFDQVYRGKWADLDECLAQWAEEIDLLGLDQMRVNLIDHDRSLSMHQRDDWDKRITQIKKCVDWVKAAQDCASDFDTTDDADGFVHVYDMR